MNKYVVEALKKYEFEFTNKHGYGFIDDYEVNVIDETPFCAPILIFSTYLKLSDRHIFKSKFKSYKIRLTKPFAFDYGVAVKIDCLRGKTFLKKIPEVIEIVLSILKYMGAKKKDICPKNGIDLNNDNSQLYIIPEDNLKVRLSKTAVEEIEKKSKRKKKNNDYILGFLGILIGAVAGVGVMWLSMFSRFITVSAPIISVFLGTLLYQKFGGKKNGVMIIMSFVTTTIAILGTFMIVAMIAASVYAEEELFDIKGFNALIYCLENIPKYRIAFIVDLIAVSVPLIGVQVGSYFNFMSQIKTPRSLK